MESEEREYQKVIDYLCKLVEKGELTIGSKLPKATISGGTD